ncbi:hypothetical protein EK904_005744 [Melospiza melodia maxima]|nr:hypothetical protein EK904_005744 [Melospiza melodia maxima]
MLAEPWQGAAVVTLSHITQLVLSHNKLTKINAEILCLRVPECSRCRCRTALCALPSRASFPGKPLVFLAAIHPDCSLMVLSDFVLLFSSVSLTSAVPANIADLRNIEVLNFFNNQIEELPTQISSLQKLKHLNLGMNRLNTLPRGFGSLPALEVLDLTYNNLNENSLPGNFFYLTTLRALYLSDNDFEMLPPDIGKLTKLQILSLRDNDLVSLPKEIGELTQLKELHIQGNRLTVLPPELVSEGFDVICVAEQYINF